MINDPALRAAEQVLDDYAVAVERAVETALQGGRFGVLVTWAKGTFRCEVSPEVPYGYVYERWRPGDPSFA